MSSVQPDPPPPHRNVEAEHTGSMWTHPYMIYIGLTAFLFLVLVGLAYLAYVNDWIPNRHTV